MKFVSDWKRVVSRSISFWFGVVGLILLPMPDIIYMMAGTDIDPAFTFWVIYGLLLVGVTGRLFQQNKSTLSEWFRMTSILVLIFTVAFFSSSYAYAHDCDTSVTSKDEMALDVATPFIAKWEGLRTEAYLDIVGVPTICYGSTRGVRLGMVKSKLECDTLLRSEVSEYRGKWLEYVTDEAYEKWLPSSRDAAYTSLAYNVGVRAAGRSTATRRLNAGNIQGGCIALGWWNRAGGRVVLGLVNRRSEETFLCSSS